MSEAARLEAVHCCRLSHWIRRLTLVCGALQVAARLEAVAARLEGGGSFAAGAAPAAGGGGGGPPPNVAAFQALMNGPMAKFIALSDKVRAVSGLAQYSLRCAPTLDSATWTGWRCHRRGGR